MFVIHPENLKPLLEGLLEAVLIVDGLDLRVHLANTAASRLLGIGVGELIGSPVIDLAVTPEDIFFWEDVAAGLSNEILSETSLRRADGTTVKVDRHVSRVVLEQGNVFYVVAIFDQSEQQRVEDELEKLVAGMESGQLSLEQSLAAHKRGLELAQFCQSKLAQAQQQVQVLEANTLQAFPGAEQDQ